MKPVAETHPSAVEILIAQAVEQGFARAVSDPVVLERIAQVMHSQGGDRLVA